jgi:hypothetical protein
MIIYVRRANPMAENVQRSLPAAQLSIPHGAGPARGTTALPNQFRAGLQYDRVIPVLIWLRV